MLRTIFLAAGSIFALSACGGDAKVVETPAPAPEAAAPMEATQADGGGKMMGGHKEKGPHGDHHEHKPLPAPAAGEDARVDFIGTDGEPTGEAVIVGGPKGILLRVDLMGIPHGFHGVHLHQVGDCSDFDGGFKLSGSHVNPEGNAHGLMNADGYERADLPNIYAHHSEHARAELFVAGLMLEDAMDEDGFAIVVHENADDHATQPIGGAGPRIACAAFTAE